MLSKTSLAFAALTLSRILLVFIINTVPDMDPSYLNLAQRIFETSDRTPINLPFGYGILLYWTVKAVGNFLLATKLIYVVFSILTGVFLYLLTRRMFDETVAASAVLVFTFIPNFTFALVGFSHTVTVAVFFLMLSLYGYWRLLNTDASISNAIIAAAAALCATLIRPELILYFLLFVAAQTLLIVYQRKDVSVPRVVVLLAVMIAVFATGLISNYSLNLRRSSSAAPTVFTDGEHAYLTYMHTLSMRAGKGVDDKLAAQLGDQTFGDAAENKQSIFRAIGRNPKEAFKNIFFNVKELLDGLGHQLFMPIFLYPLVGVGLLITDWNQLWKKHLFLIVCLIPCIAAVVLFHVEIRYLNPLAVVFSVWIALGLKNTHPRISKLTTTLVFAGLILLFVTQAVYFSQNPVGQLRAGQ